MIVFQQAVSHAGLTQRRPTKRSRSIVKFICQNGPIGSLAGDLTPNALRVDLVYMRFILSLSFYPFLHHTLPRNPAHDIYIHTTDPMAQSTSEISQRQHSALLELPVEIILNILGNLTVNLYASRHWHVIGGHS